MIIGPVVVLSSGNSASDYRLGLLRLGVWDAEAARAGHVE